MGQLLSACTESIGESLTELATGSACQVGGKFDFETETEILAEFWRKSLFGRPQDSNVRCFSLPHTALSLVLRYLKVRDPLEELVHVGQAGGLVLEEPSVAIKNSLRQERGDGLLLLFSFAFTLTCCNLCRFPTCSHILTAASIDPGTVGLGLNFAACVMVR